ncbi:hypothetical protein [Agromyces mangrovi Wang et al. 2018]|uniref:hypothetical protein n=1 Tax=Agromyces mangrovi TaxID=1858653 RepID=UPI0025743F25|nr:hypothetical protein [Agromyces mangrovi]
MDRRMLRRTTAALGIAAGALLLLAACNPGTSPVEDYAGVPEEYDRASEDPESTGMQVFWLEEGGQLAVTIWGSSGCPWVGTDISVTAEAGEGNAVEITVPELPADTACTADYAPHTTVFWTPTYVTTTEPLEVTALEQTVTLPVK